MRTAPTCSEEQQVLVEVLRRNQDLCESLNDALYSRWHDLISTGNGSEGPFPAAHVQPLEADADKARRRLRHLDEQLAMPDPTAGEDPAWRAAVDELLMTHRATCRLVFDPPENLHDFNPSYPSSGYERTWRRNHELLQAPVEVRTWIGEQARALISELDQAAEQERQRRAEAAAREGREDRLQEQDEYEQFLRRQKEREERREAARRSARQRWRRPPGSSKP